MMRLSASLIIVALAVAGSACGSASTGPAGTPETLEERASYSIGYTAGQNFSEQGAEIDVDQLVQGLRDAIEGTEPALAAEQMQATLMEYQQAMAAAADVRAEELGRANIEAGEAFLAENASREGVVVLPSGLQYEVVEQGDGPSPTATDEVTVHYEGRFLDGTPFDSSHDRGVPATFRRDPRLDRGRPAHAGGLHLPLLHPRPDRLRAHAATELPDRAQRDADLRRRAAGDQRPVLRPAEAKQLTGWRAVGGIAPGRAETPESAR
jgi:FKBP-type peptidyl-prolyl cis-trans isomerase